MQAELVDWADDIQRAADALDREAAAIIPIVRARHRVALALCQRLLATCRVVVEKKADRLPNSGWRVIVVSLVTKMMSTVRAAYALGAAGHAREVTILSRSALESLITAAFIAQKESARRAKRWAQYEIVLKAQLLGKLPDLASNPELAAQAKQILTQAGRFKRNFPNKRFWASGLGQGSVRDLAVAVEMAWYYDAPYWVGSQGTHASPVAVGGYVDVSPAGAPIFKMGLSERGLAGELPLCCDLLIRGLDVLNRCCKLRLEGLITDVAKQYTATFPGANPIQPSAGAARSPRA
jgi:hypothetical protein